MGKMTTIHDVYIEPLRQIPDERGRVMHMLRNDSPLFTQFGEVYFSEVNPGKVKAWKRHFKMTQRIAVPVGSVRFVLYDNRAASPTYGAVQEVVLGEGNYALIIIPPLLWYGFQGISDHRALIVNCADMPHDPAEAERLDVTDPSIPFAWI